MAATPHNIPILGWFEMPTLVEENFFVQSASRHGKFLVGGEFVPNISFLSSLPAPGQFNQRRIVPPPPALAEDGIYVNFAVPDGDNLDFIGGKMNAIWQDKVRGTMPITWSINPLLTELAPAILDYYYVNASEKDSFVAAPSGGGYLYPGFTPDDDLQEYLARAKNAMFAADLDTVWLLNSFRAYEIPYTEETLETYCTSLAPRGILLDYADQAVTRDVWMQEGQGVAAPVMRSTHLWSGMNNLIGKMMADIDAAPSRPHFFIVTVYPWTVELGDAVKALETLQKRYGDRVHAVSIENALSLVAQAFVDEARSALSDVQAQPLAAIDFWDHDAAISEMSQAVDHLSRQETSLAGLHAYLSLEKARRALATGVVLFLAIVIVAFLAMALLLGKPAKHERGARMAGARRWLAPGVGISALFFLFFAGLQKTMDYNFWTYASVFVAGALIVFAPRLQSLLEKSYGRNAWPVEASILAASGLFLLWEPWAFVPFACSTAMLLCRFMSGTARGKDAIFFGLGIGGTAFIRFDWISLAILTCLVAFLAHTLRPIAPPRPSGGKKEIATGVTFAATTLTLMVVWIVLYQNRYFAEKMNGGLDLQRALALIALVAAPVLALVAWKVMEPIRRMDAILTLSVATALWVVLWFAQGLLIVSCLVMALAVLMAWSFLSASSRVKWTGAMTARFASNLLILGTIVVVLVRFPAIVYSLYVVRNLPVAVEYILYTPPLLMIFATIDVIQTEALFRAARRGPGPSAEASEDA